MPKKIAFIGCSYSAYEIDGSYKDHWSYLLSLIFPQHTYRNYAKGGQGPDYFRWAILDAKIWGADAIFVSTTFDGRHAVMIDSANPNPRNEFAFEEKEISSNYSSMIFPPENVVWVSGGRIGNPYDCKHVMGFAREYLRTVPVSDTQAAYNFSWFSNIDKLYNFDKVWTLDFAKHPPHHYKHQSENVWETLIQLCNTNVHKTAHQTLFEAGICMSTVDDHWTKLGHTLVLNSYVLNEDVKNYLTQS